MDGSRGEGGGQLFRMAVALAALRSEEVRVTHIRSGRPKPGLANQHLAAAQAVARLCDGEVEGLELGSQDLTFRPGQLTGGRVEVDVGTAGSVTLVLQACLLPAAFAKGPSRLRIRGGTDVRWSPPADYFLHIFLAYLRRMGIRVEFRVIRRGYYPRGGGVVEATVEPGTPKPLNLQHPGELRALRGWAHTANLPRHVVERMRATAISRLVESYDVPPDIALQEEGALGPGGAIVLRAETEGSLLGSTALAERGVKAEEVGFRAADPLLLDLRTGATLDVHASDQLLPYMALARGDSTFVVREASGHLRTLFWLLQQFSEASFEESSQGKAVRVEVVP